MAKTVFQDGNHETGTLGTRVMAAFLNLIFNHRHDGGAQDGSAPINYAVDTGVANAYVIGLVPALTERVPGMQIIFKAVNANTGAATLTDGVGGAKAIRLPDRSILQEGDITAGCMVSVVWDGTYYIMLSWPGNSREHPVGSYWWNHVDARNPNVILGFGTWVAVPGRFILGVGGGFQAGATGGEANHVLTTAEMPPHSHPYTDRCPETPGWGDGYAVNGTTINQTHRAVYSETTGNSGSGLAHNNMPPFETAYIWRRTA